MRNIIVLIFVALLASACNLSSTEEAIVPTNTMAVIVRSTNTPLPIPTSRATNTPRPTATTQSTSGGNTNTACIPRTDWFTYRVVAGDTLGDIARRAGTTTSTLVAGNCLANANYISVGQSLLVPSLPTAPTNTPAPSNQGTLNITPILRSTAGWVVLEANATLTLTWTGAPTSASIVRFYIAPTGTGMTGQEIGFDTSPGNGSSMSWVPVGMGHIWAEAFNNQGEWIGSSPITSYQVESVFIPGEEGYLDINQVLEGDAALTVILPGSTATVQYKNFPANTTRVVFTYQPTGSTQVQQLGVDDNMADNARVQWSIGSGINGVLRATAYNANGSTLGYSANLNVRGSTTGGCRFTAGADVNYFDNQSDTTPAGTLTEGAAYETLHLGISGKFGVMLDGSGSGAAGAEALVWVDSDDLNITITGGNNCGD